MKNEIISEIEEKRELIFKIIASSPFLAQTPVKISVKPLIIKRSPFWQAEIPENGKIYHKNIPESEFSLWFEKNIAGRFRQINIFSEKSTVTYRISKKGALCRSEAENKTAVKIPEPVNNRKKNYILKEGENIPFLVDLGIFTEDFRIKSNMYDKYRQINRFIEIIDDAFKNFPKDKSLNITDFGCGKSYLTFAVYYYFTVIKKIPVYIKGYDLKPDVVELCSRTAEKYEFSNLSFEVRDIIKNPLQDDDTDVIITLHACDTATDYALYYAITHNVKYIFSVPCCQHEINSSIKKGGDFDLLLRHGLIKERFSALLTDSIRAAVLEDNGYKTNVIKLVDFTYSPKNLMLRAVKSRTSAHSHKKEIETVIQKYGFDQTLYRMLYGTAENDKPTE